MVLGLARGGVPVASQVAKALHTPFDVVVVRKLGMPINEEFAFGAIAPSNTRYLNEQLVVRVGLGEEQINQITSEQLKILNRRENSYRAGRPPIKLDNQIAILVDDGIATGATMRAAVMFARKMNAEKVIVAVPVSPLDSRPEIEEFADEFISLNEPVSFAAVGQFYEEFGQVDDDEVIKALQNG